MIAPHRLLQLLLVLPWWGGVVRGAAAAATNFVFLKADDMVRPPLQSNARVPDAAPTAAIRVPEGDHWTNDSCWSGCCRRRTLVPLSMLMMVA